MSADTSRGFGSPAPRWAVLPEPSPSVAPSDSDDLLSTHDMRDELEPTPPGSQAFVSSTKKRKPDVPASEDERAAGNKLLKKAKAAKDGITEGQRASVFGQPGPLLQPRPPPASPLDNLKPRVQVAKKRPSKSKAMKFQFELERDAASSVSATQSIPSPSESTPATTSKPVPAAQPAPSGASSSAKPRFLQKPNAQGNIPRKEPSASQPASSAKGKEIDRSSVASDSGVRWATKNTDISSLAHNRSGVPSKTQQATLVTAKDIKAPASLMASRDSVGSAAPTSIPSVGRDVSMKLGFTKPVSRDTGLASKASSSKATLAPLAQAKSKKRALAPMSDSSSDEDSRPANIPAGQSQRKSMGLTKVPRPRPNAANAKTGRRDSDSSISAEEFPSKRKKKKIKLMHTSQRADVDTSNTLTATQQRRRSAVVPPTIQVIELSSDSDKVKPPKPTPIPMKRPRASAPVNPVDVIDITDTEDEAPSPQKNTQTQPVITLKYDADGSILIDDDDEEEPVEAPERLLLPKVEKPLSTTTSGVSLVHAAISRTESVASSVQVHKPSGRTSRSPIQMPQDVERPIEEPEASAFDDNVAIEDQMQELDLGHHMDGPLHESPEGMEDAQQVSEQAVVSEPGTSPSTTPSEDADLAISTDTQLHITAEGGDQLDNADAALHDPQDITHGTSASNKLSARDMEEAPARSTRTPSFATVLSTHHRGPDAGANTTNPETSSPGPLVGSTSSRWITPLSSSARRSSKTVYGGPSGFFKDVYRSRKMSRSASRSVQGSTITSPPMSPSRERVNAVVLPEPTFESVSTRTGKAGSSADNSPGPTNPPAHEETDPRSSIGLELAYPSSRSASAPLKSNSGSPSAHARPSTQDVVNSERFAETMSSEAIPETPDADQFISASVPPDCALLEVAVPSPHEPAPNEEPIMIEGSPAPIIAETSASVVPTPPHLATSPVADAPQQPGSANVESKPSMTEVTEAPRPSVRPSFVPSRPKTQIPEGATLADVINYVWQERTRQVIDLTLGGDDEEPGITQAARVPSTSAATKEENTSPPVSTAGRITGVATSSFTTTTVSPTSEPASRPSTECATTRVELLERDVVQRPSLDSIRLTRMRQMQKQESSSRASPEGIATHQSFREAATRSNGSRKQSSAIFAACEDERFASHSDHHSRGRPAPTDARQAEEEQDHSEEDAPPAVHWRKRRRGARKETLDEGAYGPPVSPSPSQDGDSEQEIASYLDDPDVEVSVAQTRNEAVPTRRQLRPRNKSRSTAASGCSSHASRSRRSTTSESSSVGPAELSDDFDPSFVEPRIASPSDDPGFEPTSLEAVAKKAGFRMLKWGRDHRQMMKEFANHHVLAKNLPHELQDRINALSPRARKEGNMQVKLFEQAIIENTFEDESNAPPIYIVNDIDDELTPPFEFHYSNLMWHGEGVPKPDVANLRGCGCLGPCDPKSKTCACLARQKQYHPDGFLYQEGRNKGQLKAHDYPIFECNDFCGCSEDCPNRVVQHGRKQAIEIRKTRHKGWGVFNGPKKIPRNTYLGIYAGEYLVEAEAERRGAVYNKFGRTYLFDVDFYYLKVGNDDWSSKYSVDAYHAGNFTRYLNHSCDPNCYINACYINEANLEKPLLTIFTRKDVAPGEELCFSYYGNDEDEDEEPENAAEVRNFDDAVYVQCRCGARNCKGRMWKE